MSLRVGSRGALKMQLCRMEQAGLWRSSAPRSRCLQQQQTPGQGRNRNSSAQPWQKKKPAARGQEHTTTSSEKLLLSCLWQNSCFGRPCLTSHAHSKASSASAWKKEKIILNKTSKEHPSGDNTACTFNALIICWCMQMQVFNFLICKHEGKMPTQINRCACRQAPCPTKTRECTIHPLLLSSICYAIKKNKGAQLLRLENNDTTSSKSAFCDPSLCFSHVLPPQSSSQIMMF